MRVSVRLLFAPAWILASVVLVGSAFAQNAPPKVVSASQSACADTMRDVDRIACWVSVAPEPVPAGVHRQVTGHPRVPEPDHQLNVRASNRGSCRSISSSRAASPVALPSSSVIANASLPCFSW